MKKKEHKVFIATGKYTSPAIEELRIRVERGFAVSEVGVGIGDFGYDSGGPSRSGINVSDFGYESN